MKSGKVVDRDLGFKAFLERANRVKGSFTKVGVQAGSKHEDPEGVSDLVTIAAANELGTDDGRIPERSFLRTTFDKQEENVTKLAATLKQDVLTGKKDAKVALAQLGEYFQGQVQATIHSSVPPPNAPSTAARKQSTTTLVDTGQLVQSIRHVEVVKS